MLHASLCLQVLKMIYVCWRKRLIVWAPLWAMCYRSQEIGIHVSQETCTSYSCTPFIAHMLLMFTHMTLYMLMFTLVHIMDIRATLHNFVMIRYIIQNLQTILFGLESANPHGPNRVWVPKFTHILFDVGVGSRLTWGCWCFDGAFRDKWWHF